MAPKTSFIQAPTVATTTFEAPRSPMKISYQAALLRWRRSYAAPVTMISFLLIGGALEISHHAFYSSLRDTKTPDNFQQQLNIAYGTALAFLAKAALGVAVGSAYVQYMWLDFRAGYSTIASIDSKYSALHSIFSLLDRSLVRSPQIASVLAVVAWILPIAAIITPATLSVRQKTDITTTSEHLPNVNFSSLPVPTYQGGISPDLDRLAVVTAVGLRIPPLPALIHNATYSISLTGSSLQCLTPSADILKAIDNAFMRLNNITNITMFPKDDVVSNKTAVPNAVYMAFSPKSFRGGIWAGESLSPHGADALPSFIDSCVKGSDPCPFTDLTLYDVPASLASNPDEVLSTANALWLRLGQTRLVCSIQKTRYSVRFDTRNPDTALAGYDYEMQGTFNFTRKDSLENVERRGLIVTMQGLFDVLIGSSYYNPTWCPQYQRFCVTDTAFRHTRHLLRATALNAPLLIAANETYDQIWALATLGYLAMVAYWRRTEPDDQYLSQAIIRHGKTER